MSRLLLEKKVIIFCIFIFILLCFSLYGNSIRGKFIWDDIYLVSNNPYIASLTRIPQLFTQDIGAGVDRHYNFYRPVQMLSYALDHFFWKGSVYGYHITNIFLHLFVVIAIFFLVRRLFKDTLLAFLTSFLFLSHPIHTETVAYIAGRAESLAAFFILLSFFLYLKLLDRPQRLYLYAVIFFYALALLSKEYSVVLLLLILLYHYVFYKRLELRVFLLFLSLLAVTLAYFVCRQTILGSWSWPHFSPIQKIPGFFVAVTQYVILLFWPFSLHMGYEQQIFSWFDIRVGMGLLIIPAMFFLFRYRRRHPLFVFSSGWFIVALLPVSNVFFPLWTYMAEHWLYVPSIGFFLILAKGLTYLARRKDLRLMAFLLVGCLFTFYSALTIRQNYYWKDPVIFYEKTLKYTPDNTAVLINLGMEYNNRGEQKKAVALFIKALDILLQSSVANNNLALEYVQKEKISDAIFFFKKAILGVSYNDYLHYGFMRIGDAVLVRKVKEMDAIKAKLYYNLAQAYLDMKNSEKALKCFKKAIEIDPTLKKEYQGNQEKSS